jgi:hypothetical protein
MKLIKSVIRKFDNFLLNGVLTMSWRVYQLSMRENGGRQSIGKFFAVFPVSGRSTLEAIAEKWDCDKGVILSGRYPWKPHAYTDVYAFEMEARRYEVKNVLECGIGTNNESNEFGVAQRIPGASLRVWRDYFPAANIIGLDIDPDTLFHEDRILTFCVDQTSTLSINNFLNLPSITSLSFDFIVDDGLHTFEAGTTLFECLISRLSPGGLYVIEDVDKCLIDRYVAYFRDLKDHIVSVASIFRPGIDLHDNSLILIRKSN